MVKYADLWRSAVGADGRIVWPPDLAGRDALARTLFGAGVVDALDRSLAKADDLIDNPTPPEKPWLRRAEDPACRPTFAAMSSEQRAVVRKLVRDAALDVLFRTFVHVDQTPAGRFAISLENGDGEGNGGGGGSVHPTREDLHDQLYDWVWDLSAYRDALMSRTPTGRGGHADQWRVTGDLVGGNASGEP